MQQEACFCNASNLSKPPQVGTNLTDLTLKKKKVTLRELGGCMSPIWPSYFEDCSSVIVCSYIVCFMYFQRLSLTVGIFWVFCVRFHSSWSTQSTLLRYLRLVSSCCQCCLLSLCTVSQCLSCSTRGDTQAFISTLTFTCHTCKI